MSAVTVEAGPRALLDPATWRRSAAGAAVWLLVIAFFSVDLWAWGRQYESEHVRGFTYALVFAVLAVWLLRKLVRREALTSTPLDLPLVALLFADGVAALLSRYPYAAAEPLIQSALLVLAFKGASDLLASGASPARLLGYLLVGSGGFCFLVMVEFYAWYAGPPWPSTQEVYWLQTGAGLVPPSFPRMGPLAGPVIVSGYIGVLFPPAVAWFINARSRLSRTLLAGWLLLAGTALLLTASRSGWLAAAAGCFVVLLSLWGAPIIRSGLPRARMPGAVQAAIGLGVAILIVVTVTTTLGSRASSTLQRLYITSEAVQVWLQAPLTGVGPGNYALAQLAVRPDAIIEDIHIHAHNLGLQALAVAGALGLAAAAWLAWRFARAALQGWAVQPPGDRVVRAGFLGGVAGWLVFGLTDLPTYSFLLTLTGAALAALAIAAPHPPVPARASGRYRAGLLTLLLLSGCAFVVVETERGRVFQAVQLAREGRWEEAALVVRTAPRAAPVGTFYDMEAGLLYGNAGRWQEADRAYRAAEGGPLSAAAIATAAYVAEQAGDRARALDLARRAGPMVPREPRYPLLLGWLYERMGETSSAVEAYGLALALRPAWLASTYWDAPERMHLKQAVIAAALQAGDTYPDLPSPERAVLKGQLLNRLGRMAEAEGVLSEALSQVQWRSPTRVIEALEQMLAGQSRAIARSAYAVLDPAGSQSAAYYQLGIAAQERGNLRLADEHFRKAIASGPGNPAGYLGRGALAFVRKDYETAVRHARTALAYAPATAVLYHGDRRASALLGRALLRAGHPAEAIPHLRRAIQQVRPYTSEFGLKVYGRPEVLPPVLSAVPDLLPDREIAVLEQDLAEAVRLAGQRP